MGLDPRNPAFWADMSDGLWTAIGETMLSIYLKGAEGGVDGLPKDVQVLADATTVNANALRFLEEYRGKWVEEMTRTTREQTLKIFEDWIVSGQPLPVLVEALDPIFGKGRAETIAVTETTRIFAQGNQSVWEESGLVEEAIWMTGQDDLVCPVCSELQGTHVGIGDMDASPPAHVNCRCYLQPVVSEDALARKLDEILAQ